MQMARSVYKTAVSLFLLCLLFVPSYGVFGWLHSIKCFFTVCCNDKWIIKSYSGLERDLNSKLHGQHLVKKTVLGHIKAHFKLNNPSKALVLSFHGPTGVGKNYVSRIIAENIYKDGMRNPFVHLIAATKEFQHEGMIHLYKEKLKELIEVNVKKCERSMFIFDEIDKLPSQLLDVLKPYVDHYEHLGGVNYRKAIFIFLSNTGSSKIMNIVMQNWKAGKKREDLELRDVEHSIMLSAINDEREAGLWHSHLINHNLITAFIPFLPLEKEQVRQCVKDDLIAKSYYKQRSKIKAELVDEVIEELKFIPLEEELFSSTGCKRVSEKVDFVMIDNDWHYKESKTRQRHEDL